MSNKKFETDVVHHGYDAKEMLGSLAVPIYQTSTFEFNSAAHGANCFSGEDSGYMYSRLGNPTVHVLEERIAALENGEQGLAFSSGMGAISAVIVALTKAGDHVLCSKGLYGCTFGLLMMMKEKYQMSVDFTQFSTEEEIRAQIRDETSLIYIETPINPTMELVDLEMVASVAKEYDIPVVVDNTFASPYLQRPLELGCDVVVHSATKYLNGHGDVVAGLAVGTKAFMDEVSVTTQKDMGAILSPFDAWLLLRGIKTLPLRMDRHCDNAEKIAEKLKDHEKVSAVYYPGIDNPVFQKQMKRGSGVIAFEINGTEKEVQKCLDALHFIKVAVSLGDAETLIEHPASMTHAVIPEAERIEMGISNTLIRLSIGLEAESDIWEDLNQALNQL